MQEVRLTWSEVLLGAEVGKMRNISSLKRGSKSRFLTPNNWGVNIEGACAEIAVSKALGRPWPGSINNFDGPDIEPDIQVRSASSRQSHLIVRPKDKDSEFYFLVVGKAPNFIVVGWIKGCDAKQERWLQNPSSNGDGREPAFFVPQQALTEPCLFLPTYQETYEVHPTERS